MSICLSKIYFDDYCDNTVNHNYFGEEIMTHDPHIIQY